MPIYLENITKKYGSQIILDSINLTIEDHEMTAITGKSGSGKSTLLNILGLLEPYQDGNLRINNILNPETDGKDATKLRRNVIGYVFQNFALAENLTVLANLKLALAYQRNKQNQSQILKALSNVSLPERILKQPVYQLSGGEQQRVAIARLFLKPCEIILADEPTGSLDIENRNLIIDIFHALHEAGKTIIIVTHDKNVSSSCSRRLTLLDGTLSADN